MAPDPQDVRECRRRQNFSRELLEKGWYHSFELPDGSRIEGYMGLDAQRRRWARFPLPENLAGRRVLDIGAWDGWFSFEAERRGAAVTAIDCVEIPGFLQVHRALGSRVDYRILDFYELPEASLGRFDIVLFLGVLYHLKHPLLALEIVCALTEDIALVESFVTDGDTWREHTGEIPTMEFYETDELAEQLDNWNGPTVGCLLALCRAAGFARVELLGAHGHNAAVACYRRWEAPPPDAAPAPELMAVRHNRNFGINFSTRREEYLSAWFRTGREEVARGQVRLEVDGLGVPALYVRREAGGEWMANFRLPPGLAPGWRPVRVALEGSAFSAAQRIAVDMPARAATLALKDICGGLTWTPGRVTPADRGFASCWIAGLADNCDRNNIRATAGGARLAIDWIGEPDPEGYRQLNLALPAGLAPGEYEFRVEFGGAVSPGVPLKVEA